MLKSLLILGAAVSRTAASPSDAGAQASALPPLAPAGADSADDLYGQQAPEFTDEEKRGWDEELRGMWKGGGDVVHEESTGARGAGSRVAE
eukprot:COSAG04_NODE_24_length_37684_cov_50.391060_20_plen_91_part_00